MIRVMPFVLAFVVGATVPASGSTAKLVVCAPGFPGTTAEAQPSLDAFSRAAAKAAGWPEGDLAAVYFPSEDAGLAALAGADASLALVAFPFLEKHAATLRLVPVAQAVSKVAGAEEAWSLVAKKGRIQSASQLSGWEIVSVAGYAPGFVRGRALADWGKIPADTRVTASSQVLSALRRVNSGENLAVLLDGTQTAGLPSLPFAAELEIVAVSPKVPTAVLCAVGTRMPRAQTRAFVAALEKLHETPDGAAALDGIRLLRFVPSSLPAPSPKPKAGAARK